jgi:hypothetical protein
MIGYGTMFKTLAPQTPEAKIALREIFNAPPCAEFETMLGTRGE